jgi:hypothetical protein
MQLADYLIASSPWPCARCTGNLLELLTARFESAPQACFCMLAVAAAVAVKGAAVAAAAAVAVAAAAGGCGAAC